MKLLASTVLLSAASAAMPPSQHVFQQPLKAAESVVEPIADMWSKPLETLSDALKGMTAEAKAVWDEVAMHFPEAMDKASFFSAPKPHVRKPDSVWDYVVKGADIQRYENCFN
jgi:cathepsin A (carboxypeptidase C)